MSSSTPASVSGVGEGGEGERERGVSRNTRAHKRSTRPVHSGEVTSPAGFISAHTQSRRWSGRENKAHGPRRRRRAWRRPLHHGHGMGRHGGRSSNSLLPSWDLTLLQPLQPRWIPLLFGRFLVFAGGRICPWTHGRVFCGTKGRHSYVWLECEIWFRTLSLHSAGRPFFPVYFQFVVF